MAHGEGGVGYTWLYDSSVGGTYGHGGFLAVWGDADGLLKWTGRWDNGGVWCASAVEGVV